MSFAYFVMANKVGTYLLRLVCPPTTMYHQSSLSEASSMVATSIIPSSSTEMVELTHASSKANP